jgi:hypothetical protein
VVSLPRSPIGHSFRVPTNRLDREAMKIGAYSGRQELGATSNITRTRTAVSLRGTVEFGTRQAPIYVRKHKSVSLVVKICGPQTVPRRKDFVPQTSKAAIRIRISRKFGAERSSNVGNCHCNVAGRVGRILVDADVPVSKVNKALPCLIDVGRARWIIQFVEGELA